MPDIKSLKITEENIYFTQFEYKSKTYKIKLLGRHQVYNALTVIETMDCLFVGNDPRVVPCKKIMPIIGTTQGSFPTDVYNAIYNGIEKTFFPARFEILSEEPLVIFDGAHNISGVIVLK